MNLYLATAIYAGCLGQMTDVKLTYYSCTLQKLLYEEGSRCLTVKADFSYSELPSGDFARYKVRDVRLFVDDSGLGYQNGTTAFLFKGEGFTTGFSSSGALNFESGMIIDPALCVLPTARLVNKDNKIYLVLFDGKRGRMYYKSKEMGKFEIKNDRTVEDSKVLTDLYLTSFDPSDVHWDLFLVVEAPFFGFRSATNMKNRAIDTKALYDLWKTIKLQPLGSK